MSSCPFGSSGALSEGEGGTTWSAHDTRRGRDPVVRRRTGFVAASASVARPTRSFRRTGTTHLIFEEGRSLPNETEAVRAAGRVPGRRAGIGRPGVARPCAECRRRRAPRSSGSSRCTTSSPAISTVATPSAVAWLSATIDEVNAAYVRSGCQPRDGVGRASSRSPTAVTVCSATTELNRITGTSDGVPRRGARPTRRRRGRPRRVRRADGFGDVRLGVAADPAGHRERCGVRLLRRPSGLRSGEPDLRPRNGPQPRGRSWSARAARRRAVRERLPQRSRRLSNDHGLQRSAACPGGSVTRVPHFSSPTVLYNGQPTGSATQDNARVLSELAPCRRAVPAAVPVAERVSGGGGGCGAAGRSIVR